jgi:hypothetical protein
LHAIAEHGGAVGYVGTSRTRRAALAATVAASPSAHFERNRLDLAAPEIVASVMMAPALIILRCPEDGADFGNGERAHHEERRLGIAGIAPSG